MAANINQSLEHLLECPLCHKQLHNARLISCGHSFCLKCLDHYISAKANEYKGRGADVVIGNLILIRCPRCLKKLWTSRQINDQTPAVLVNNVIEALKTIKTDQFNTCCFHKGKEKKYICERCRECVCSECAVEKHFSHGSRPKTISEVKDLLNDLVKQSEEKISSHIEFESQLEYLQKHGTNILEGLEKVVLERYQDCSTKLLESKNQMSSDIEEQRQFFREKSTALLSEQHTLALQISQVRLEAKRALDTGDGDDIVKNYTSFAEQLRQLETTFAQSTRDIKADVKSFEGLTYEPPASVPIRKYLGCIKCTGLDKTDTESNTSEMTTGGSCIKRKRIKTEIGDEGGVD